MNKIRDIILKQSIKCKFPITICNVVSPSDYWENRVAERISQLKGERNG